MDLTLYLVVALTFVLIPHTTCSSHGKLGGDCNGAYVCRRPVRRPGIPYKRMCVRRTSLCDGVKQCPRGDDERACRPVIVCPLLNWPANGYVKHDGFQSEDTAIYSCAIGYELTGTATRTCLQTGSWEGSVPTCSPIVPDIVCPLLDSPANGTVTHDGFQPEDTAIYSCAIGFELTGTDTRTCLQTGSWEGSAPTCSLDCYVSGRAKEYAGTQNVNENNELCGNWTKLAVDANLYGYVTDSNFPDGSVAAASNYCRSPNNYTVPWCMDINGAYGNCINIPSCDL